MTEPSFQQKSEFFCLNGNFSFDDQMIKLKLKAYVAGQEEEKINNLNCAPTLIKID